MGSRTSVLPDAVRYDYLVRLTAKRVAGRVHFQALSLEDLEQEGRIGLLYALQTRDATAEAAYFRYYAIRVIRAYIVNAMRDWEWTPYVKARTAQDGRQKVESAIHHLKAAGKPVSDDADCELLGWTTKKRRQHFSNIAVADRPCSLQATARQLGEVRESTLQDILPSEMPSLEDAAALTMQINRLSAAVGQLDERTCKAIKMHHAGYSDAEIGQIVGCSRAKGRELHVEGEIRLRALLMYDAALFAE